MKYRLLFSAIDVSGAPSEFRIFEQGKNASDHGEVYFTAKSAKSVIAKLASRDVMIDLEHLSLSFNAPNHDPDARGWAKLEVRNGELWAVDVRWTDDGRSRIESKRQRYISPAFYTNKNGEITSLINIALTALPAMHNTPALIAASIRKETEHYMDPKLLEALGLPPDATLEQALAAIAAMKNNTMTGGSETVPKDEDSNKETEESIATSIATVIKPLVDQINSLSKRIDHDERARLMSGRDVTPAVRKFLDSQPIETVRAYMSAVPVSSPAEPPKGNDPNKLSEEQMHLCKITGTDPDKIRKFNAKNLGGNQ
jgi:phage I-like protein